MTPDTIAAVLFGFAFGVLAGAAVVARMRATPNSPAISRELVGPTTEPDPLESTRDVGPLREIPNGQPFPVHINPIDHRRTGVELRNVS